MYTLMRSYIGVILCNEISHPHLPPVETVAEHIL